MISNPTRRRLLKTVGVFFLIHPLKSVLASSVKLDKPEKDAFSAFLNVLLPADKFTASATDLHVDKKLWSFSKSDPRFKRLIELGCTWLNMTGGPPFAELSDEQKITVVEWMSRSDWNEVPRRFYELIRQTAVEMYYSQPAAWKGLPIQHPPQPNGYPPPWT